MSMYQNVAAAIYEEVVVSGTVSKPYGAIQADPKGLQKKVGAGGPGAPRAMNGEESIWVID